MTVQLTQREHQVLRKLADGRTADQAAEDLRIEVTTVRTHIANIYRKMGVHTRAAAVGQAMRNGYID